jgi:hypothetical protein
MNIINVVKNVEPGIRIKIKIRLKQEKRILSEV